MTLDEIRLAIDSIDTKIIGLLSERGTLVTAAGRLKRDEQGVRDPKRVEQVIGEVRTKAVEAGLDPNIAEDIYREIIGCFVRKELREFAESSKKRTAPDGSFQIRKAVDQDRDRILAVFNHYVEQSFAAYPDRPLDSTFFDFMKTIVYEDAFFVLETQEKRIAGFGFLKKYHPYPAFKRTAETGYFILPEFTRKGLGTRLLEALEKEARALGVRTLLANVSSLNPQSLGFHQKQGFRECGRFKKIVRKFGQDMDIVWMQKML